MYIDGLHSELNFKDFLETRYKVLNIFSFYYRFEESNNRETAEKQFLGNTTIF